MSHRILQLAVFLGLVFTITAPAWSHPARQRTFGPRGPEAREARRARLAEHLDLSAEQREQLRDIRREARRAAILRHGEMAELRARIRAEMMAEELDAAAVRALAAELGKHAAEAAEARLNRRLEALEVLTTKQREALQDLRERRHALRERRGQRIR